MSQQQELYTKCFNTSSPFFNPVFLNVTEQDEFSIQTLQGATKLLHIPLRFVIDKTNRQAHEGSLGQRLSVVFAAALRHTKQTASWSTAAVKATATSHLPAITQAIVEDQQTKQMSSFVDIMNQYNTNLIQSGKIECNEPECKLVRSRQIRAAGICMCVVFCICLCCIRQSYWPSKFSLHFKDSADKL